MCVFGGWGAGGQRTLCDGSQANPPELDQAEDLASLVSVNESSVLNTLLHRHRARLLHTCAGPDLIVLQPQGPTAPSAAKVRGHHGARAGGLRKRGGVEGSLCISGESRAAKAPCRCVCGQHPADMDSGAPWALGSLGDHMNPLLRGEG